MQLTIDAGLINVWSQDQEVNLIVHPRRSMAGDPTKAQVRCAPMPLVEFQPEDVQGAVPCGQWVWNGSPSDAMRICDLILAQLPQVLRQESFLSPRAKRWRLQVLSSLNLVQTKAGLAAPHKRRAKR